MGVDTGPTVPVLVTEGLSKYPLDAKKRNDWLRFGSAFVTPHLEDTRNNSKKRNRFTLISCFYRNEPIWGTRSMIRFTPSGNQSSLLFGVFAVKESRLKVHTKCSVGHKPSLDRVPRQWRTHNHKEIITPVLGPNRYRKVTGDTSFHNRPDGLPLLYRGTRGTNTTSPLPSPDGQEKWPRLWRW